MCTRQRMIVPGFNKLSKNSWVEKQNVNNRGRPHSNNLGDHQLPTHEKYQQTLHPHNDKITPEPFDSFIVC